jgi:hypothetical protein
VFAPAVSTSLKKGLKTPAPFIKIKQISYIFREVQRKSLIFQGKEAKSTCKNHMWHHRKYRFNELLSRKSSKSRKIIPLMWYREGGGHKRRRIFVPENLSFPMRKI